MSQKMRIFKKERAEKKNGKSVDKSYYWASISDTDKNGEWISANVFVRLSNSAAKTFRKLAEETKNADVTSAWVNVTDCWLKAVPGKEQNNIVLFVNEMEELD